MYGVVRKSCPTVHRVVLPFKDQKSADAVKKQLSDLSNKIDHTLQPVLRVAKYVKTSRCVSQNHP